MESEYALVNDLGCCAIDGSAIVEADGNFAFACEIDDLLDLRAG